MSTFSPFNVPGGDFNAMAGWGQSGYQMPLQQPTQSFAPTGMNNVGYQGALNSLPQTDNAGGGFWGGLMGSALDNSKTGQQGWAMPAISAFTGLAGTYMGMKQYGLAKDAFKESKRQFQMNFDAQQQDYNRRLSDSSAERERYNQSFGIEGGPTQAEYMSQWGQGNNSNGNESSNTPRDRVPTGRLKGRAG